MGSIENLKFYVYLQKADLTEVLWLGLALRDQVKIRQTFKPLEMFEMTA
jgi:hypothetical protein